MKKLIFIFMLLISSSLFIACGGGGDDGGGDIQPTPPGSLNLESPANNSSVTTQVTFSWGSSLHATLYDLYIKDNNGANLVDPITDITGTSYTINDLPYCTGFVWYVVAKNSDGTKESNTFSATTAGSSTANHLPIPESVIFSYDNDNVAITLTDAENEDITYTLETSPTYDFSSVQELSSATVSSGTTVTQENLNLQYGITYWLRIKISDEHGNSYQIVVSHTPD